MILNQEQSSAVITGEIQNNKVGIDINNINFITTLLTSNLYSLPIESFLRETVANAWDSQVEAGNTNTPILIEINSVNNDDATISIRDYGTGLSPERFNEIYRNIGSSTKRESNEYIGALGIGRFSALAVCDIVNIKSYYQGKCYSYLMYKDGETLNIDLLGITDTTFDNGVEVQVTIKNAYYERTHITKGLAALTYFEQLYVDCNIDYLKSFVDKFNKRTIHEFENFKVCSVGAVDGLHILMGNILYECTDTSYIEFGNNPNIAVKCNIGDIDITPNRESIRYSAKTKETLDNKIAEVNAEIYSLAKDIRTGDFATVKDWYDTMTTTYFYLSLWEFEYDGATYDVRVEINKSQLQRNNIEDNCTVRGKKVPKDLEQYYNIIKYAYLPSSFLTYIYQNQQFCQSQKVYIDNLYKKKLFWIDEPYKPITKKYFRENILPFDDAYFVSRSRLKSAYVKTLKEILDYIYKCDGNIDKDCIRIIQEDIFELFNNIPTFNNNDVPKDFIQAQKAEKTEARQRRECVIYTLDSATRGYYKDTNEQGIVSRSEATLKQILGCTQTVIYAEKGSEDLRFMFRIFRKAGLMYHYKFIETAKVNMPILKSLNKFIHVDRLMSEYNRDLAKLFTNKYIKDLFAEKYLHSCYGLLDYSEIVTQFKRNKSITFSVSDAETIKDFQELYEYYVSKNWIDTSIINSLSNPNIEKLSNFLEQRHVSYPNDLEKVAIMYYVYKNNIRIGNLNPLTAYKYIKTKLS